MKKRKENKKAEVFGMSFGMIFSIILIVFILVVAGIAINAFLNTQKCAQIGLFIEDLQKDVDSAWNSEKSSLSAGYNLPLGLNYVCFANLSEGVSGGTLERDIYNEISLYKLSEGNMFFYPRTKSCNMPYINLKHIDISGITSSRNPYCFEVKEGKVSIKIEKGFNQALVGLK